MKTVPPAASDPQRPPPQQQGDPTRAVALLAYTVLAIACTWPLVAHLHDRVLGYAGFENTDQTLWLYAEWKATVAVAAHDLLAPAPFSPSAWGAFAWTVLSFPAKVSMANGIDFAFTWPLDLMLGVPAYYNVKCMLILVANAVSGERFARALGCRRRAAWAGGAAFAFNPHTFYLLSTGRVIECILFPLALYALCLWRAWTDGGRWILWSGVWLGAAGLVFWFNLHFLAVYTAIFLVSMAMRDRHEAAARLLRLLLVPLVATVLLMPAAMPYLVMLTRGESLPGAARGDGDDETARYLIQTRSWSCDAAYGLQPMSTSALDEATFSPPWGLPAMHTFDGLLTTAAIISLFALRAPHRFLGIAFLFLYTLPLGPVLKNQGRVVEIGAAPISLPFSWMVKTMPLLDHLFFPSVSMGLWALTCAMVLALGATHLTERSRSAGWLGPIVVVTSLLHMYLLGQWPLPTTPLRIPPLYTTAREGFIYLPINRPYWQGEHSPNREPYVEPDLKHVDLHLALHGLKSLWGRNQYLAGADIWMFQPPTARANSFLRWLLDTPSRSGTFEAADLQQVRATRLRYVVVMERLCSHQARGGDYQLDLERGAKVYDELHASLVRRFGPPVHEATETTWEKYLQPGTVTPHDYRIAIFDLDGQP